MTDYTNLLERLAVSAGDQECLYADAKAAIEALQTRLAEAEDTNKALRVRLGSELHEPVTTVDDRHNADGKSCHITDDLPAGMELYAAPPVAAPVRLTDEQAEKVDEAIREALGDAYDCLRVWNAWSYGTMGPDDFSQVAEDSDRVAEIRNAAAVALGFKLEGEQ